MERSKEYGAEVEISDWASLARGGIDAAIRVWPLDNRTEKYPALAGRLTMTLRTGAATVLVHPTAAEARDLIAALQWALEPAEQLTGEVAACARRDLDARKGGRMNAPRDILGAIADDPNVAPALRAALKPQGFGQYDNYVISNRLGQRVSVVFAESAEQALHIAHAPDGYSARIERYGCPVDAALRERVSASWGSVE